MPQQEAWQAAPTITGQFQAIVGQEEEAAESRLQRVADVMVRNQRILHKAMHPMLPGGMEKCRELTCVQTRWVLGQV